MSAPATAAELAPLPTPIIGTGRPDKYLHPDGKQVPGTTTIAGRFADKQQLIAWAHKQGIQGIPLNDARDKGADVGHVVHAWIEDDIHGRPLRQFPFTPDEIIALADKAFQAYKAWALRVGLRILATEIPLVHSGLRYGGTLDAIALVDGHLSLVDWKSGNRCYPEHLIQQAAYRELLRDAAAELERAGRAEAALPVPESATLVRLDKETGEPHARTFDSDSLDLAWDYFALILTGYRLDQAVSKLVAEPKKKASKKEKAA